MDWKGQRKRDNKHVYILDQILEVLEYLNHAHLSTFHAVSLPLHLTAEKTQIIAEPGCTFLINL